MVCCKCNRTGHCRNCACVKAKKTCDSCLPCRLGQCQNTCCQNNSLITSATDAAYQPRAVQSASEPNASRATSTLMTSSGPSILPRDLNSPPSPSPATDNTTSSQSIHSASPNGISELPNFIPSQKPTFLWGNCGSDQFIRELDECYCEVVHWKPNHLKLLSGKAGKSVVAELARLYSAYASSSALESVALKAAVVLPHLLLQKPSRASKSRDHIACLERRMPLWCNGKLIELLLEGRAIQERRPKSHSKKKKPRSSAATSFAERMYHGRTKEALELLKGKERGGTLNMFDRIPSGSGDVRYVRDVLLEKHPPGQPAHTDSLLQNETPPIHPVIFDSIDSDLIRTATLRTSGSAGPSGLDARVWRRLCTCYNSASRDLCQAFAGVAKRLCTEFVDPANLAPLLASRLVALNKKPGVRPIGVGNTARRIIAKAIMMTER